MGEKIGGFIFYLFILFVLMGVIYFVIDLGVGEKECGMLEILLLILIICI